MPLSLANLQSRFADALHYQASGDECAVVSDHFSADQRIQIYRSNFIIGLSDVLQATYPKVLALVGDECFAQMARHHVLTQPLCQGNVSAYGQAFDQSIHHFEQVMAHAPYLVDMARLEWRLDKAMQRHSDEPNTTTMTRPLEEMATLSAEQQDNIQLRLQPSCQLITSQYAIIGLWHAMDNQQLEQLDLSRAEQGALFIDQYARAHAISLSQPAFELLQRCRQTHTLTTLPSELLPQLSELVTNQIVVGFELANEESTS